MFSQRRGTGRVSSKRRWATESNAAELSKFGFRKNFMLTLVMSTYPGEGNGNPLQYSCLENPIDRGA